MSGDGHGPADGSGAPVDDDLEVVAAAAQGRSPALDAALYPHLTRGADPAGLSYLAIADGSRSGFTPEQADLIVRNPHYVAHLKALWTLAPPPDSVFELADQDSTAGRAHRRLLEATTTVRVDPEPRPPAGRPTVAAAAELPRAGAGRTRRRGWAGTLVAAAVALVVLAAAVFLGLNLRNPAGVFGPAPATTAASPTVPFAQDTFDRRTRNGLGTADRGGMWSISGSNAVEIGDYSTADGNAVFSLSSAGVRRTGYLDEVRELSADVTADAVVDKPAVGGAIYMSLIGRQISYYQNYVADVRIDQERRLRIGLSKNVDRETNSPISAYLVVPGPVEAGEPVHIRLQVFGANPTTIRAKTWHGSAAEPPDWTVQAADGDPPLQQPGGVGFTTYLNGTATNAPVTVRVPELVARPVG